MAKSSAEGLGSFSRRGPEVPEGSESEEVAIAPSEPSKVDGGDAGVDDPAGADQPESEGSD